MLKNATLLSLFVLLFSVGLWAQADQPMQILDNYLKVNYERLGLTSTDVANYEISSELVSKHNKLSHLYLQQSHDGIPVFNAILNANILPNGEMLSIGNRFVTNLAQKVNTTSPVITTERAVASVLDYFRLEGISSLTLDRKINDREYIYHQEGIALEPVRVHLMYQPMPDETVRLVWNVDLYQLDAQHWWLARVDAITGEVLDYFDQVVHCTFDHSAEDDCREEYLDTRNLKKYTSSDSQTAAPAAVLMTGGDETSAYRVFPLPLESPSHGERVLVINPADPVASPFGWHDTNGVEGPEYTITRGNTVHAYHDIYDLDQSVGGEPDGGDSLCFDFPLDLSLGRPYMQLDAATTNLFYWNNVIHDFWFHYGFDEAAGNFQERNYSGAPGASDYLQAEALDGSGTNNANMSTPADGGSPRMQMYLWGGSLPELTESSNIFDFEVLAPTSLTGSYEYVAANFGGTLPDGMPLVSQVVLVNDGNGVGSDACQSIVNGADLVGKIAMIDRGSCQIGSKALAAQEAGAAAVMICNNQSQAYDGMDLVPGSAGNQVTIPVFGVELSTCNQLKTGLPDLEFSIVFQVADPFAVPLPGPTGLDSDFDNGIIAHEYAHGISNRLTGGRLQSGCLDRTQQLEQAGEGWSDFFTLAMTTTSANYADEPRGIGTYSDGQAVTGGGIRTNPYSRSMLVNDDTYSIVSGLITGDPTVGAYPVHRIGTIWCIMLWDLYWNLVDEYGFDDDLILGTGGNNMAMQLVMDGFKLQPCNPSFVEARDAILEADIVNYGGANQCLIWETFARRGLGVNAAEGGVEDFNLPVNCPEAFYVRKTAVATANAGEIITYELEIANGLSSLVEEAIVIDQLPTGTTLVEGSSDCNISVVDGQLTLNLGNAAAGEVFNCSYQLQTSMAPFSYAVFEDRVTNLSKWDNDNPLGDVTWGLRVNAAFSGIVSIYAGGVNVVADQTLTLSEPVFLDNTNPGLSFYHRFSLEDGYDGGVIEISADGGDTWEDVGAENFIENGYTGMLEDSDNPLSGRPAFTNTLDQYFRSIVDLSAYAGETVLIRFRLGTDTGGGAREGWYLDDITIYGNLRTITNTACTSNNGENLCSSVVTVLNEGIVATENIDQDRPMQLFPNPTAGELTVALPNVLNEQVEISILGIDGRELQKQTYNGFLRETLDLGTLPAGVYMLQFRTAATLTTRKVIVE
jgi:uncharacterized repeat protein (TIGR01451 family)